MTHNTTHTRRWSTPTIALLICAGLAGAAGAQTPSGVSTAKAKELAAVMKGKNIESFAVREGTSPNRFVAVMLVPDVQLLLVSAAYSRPTDIEYRIYQKDFSTAYQDLRNGTLASERFYVEDFLGDGLIATPAKNAQPDSVTIGTAAQLFEGAADPKKRNDKRLPADAYLKAFTEADKRYADLLAALIQELKKAGDVTIARELR